MNKSPTPTSKTDLIRFWAKTTDKVDHPQRKNAYHPLICHMIDVACVAQIMWRDVLPGVIKRRLAKPFGLGDGLDADASFCLQCAGNCIAEKRKNYNKSFETNSKKLWN